jgi:hypothetical protein
MVLLGMVWTGPARGQQSPPLADDELVDPDDEADEVLEDEETDTAKGPKRPGSGEPKPAEGDRRAQELEYLTKLRRAVTKEIRLSDDQTRAVMDLFRAHTEFVETYESKEPENTVDPKAAEAERQKLQEELREARQNRDRDRVMQLMEKLREGQSADEITRATRRFHQEVAAELDSEQQQQFREMVRRLYKQPEDPMEAARNRMRGIRTMRRVLDELELSDEQNEAVRDVFRQSMQAFGDPGRDPEQVIKMQEELKAKLLDILDDDQADKFEERMKYYEENPEAMPDPGRRGDRPTRPRPRTGGRGPAAPPTQQ